MSNILYVFPTTTWNNVFLILIRVIVISNIDTDTLFAYSDLVNLPSKTDK
jgi:hypothetical protein